jgi:hypothetical protein
MAITSQMIYARVVMEAQTLGGSLAVAERAEEAEQKAAG